MSAFHRKSLIYAYSGVLSQSRFYSFITLPLGAHGVWFPGYTKRKSTHWQCVHVVQQQPLQQIGYILSIYIHTYLTDVRDLQLFGFVCTQFTSVGIRNLGYKFYISKSNLRLFSTR